MYTRDNQFTNLSKLMFLSATPEPRVEETFRTHLDDMVNYVSLPCTAGWKPYSDIDPDGPYRTVMPPVSLDIVESNNFQADAAIIEEFGRVCNWCRQGDRTLIIVDSLAEVNNLYTRFNRELDSLNVERISGLHTENKRAKLDRFDLMISNSAVEAGIDFDIDRLLMSAVDGRSLLQRLGRIRNKDPTGRDPWPVTCYVKGDLVKALQTLPPTPRERVTRPGFAAAVTDRYAFRELPAMFATTYSAAELYHHSMARAEQFAVDDRREYERRTLALLERTMFDAVGESFDHDALASIYRQQDTQLLDHLQTYRDAGFQSLLYDTTATTPEQSIKTYNTLTLPTQADVRFVTKETFYEYAPESQHDVVEYKSRFTNGYALYFGPRNNKGDDERGVLRLVPSGALRVEIEKPVDERQPVVSSGYTLAFDEHDPTVGLPALNDELRETSIIAYPVNDSAYMVKHRNNLSPFFSTMELRDVRGQVCATLGYDALYMHCYDRATAE
jgi:CRISPR-associated endonuclease/helicase Cas3